MNLAVSVNALGINSLTLYAALFYVVRTVLFLEKPRKTKNLIVLPHLMTILATLTFSSNFWYINVAFFKENLDYFLGNMKYTSATSFYV